MEYEIEKPKVDLKNNSEKPIRGKGENVKNIINLFESKLLDKKETENYAKIIINENNYKNSLRSRGWIIIIPPNLTFLQDIYIYIIS